MVLPVRRRFPADALALAEVPHLVDGATPRLAHGLHRLTEKKVRTGQERHQRASCFDVAGGVLLCLRLQPSLDRTGRMKPRVGTPEAAAAAPRPGADTTEGDPGPNRGFCLRAQPVL